ncbi:MAG: hypothetical protein QG629_896, partial [Patescibacteria group bacterium]|nr:hypothetical protein [Patescibacteria group bacterium]
YEVTAAQNGEEALVLAKQHRPDLIISDVMMPRISGFEMLDILRNTDELKSTKVIMLTALGQADDRGRADNLGADKYLVKSQVTLEDIVGSARELLGEGVAGGEPVPATTAESQPAATEALQQPVPAAETSEAPANDTASTPDVQSSEVVMPQVETTSVQPVAPEASQEASSVSNEVTAPVAAPEPVVEPTETVVTQQAAPELSETNATVDESTPLVTLKPQAELQQPSASPELPDSNLITPDLQTAEDSINTTAPQSAASEEEVLQNQINSLVGQEESSNEPVATAPVETSVQTEVATAEPDTTVMPSETVADTEEAPVVEAADAPPEVATESTNTEKVIQPIIEEAGEKTSLEDLVAKELAQEAAAQQANTEQIVQPTAAPSEQTTQDTQEPQPKVINPNIDNLAL